MRIDLRMAHAQIHQALMGGIEQKPKLGRLCMKGFEHPLILVMGMLLQLSIAA